jgi:hypothetical protein
LKAQLKCSASRQAFVNPTTVKRKIREAVQLVRDFGAFRVRCGYAGRYGSAAASRLVSSRISLSVATAFLGFASLLAASFYPGVEFFLAVSHNAECLAKRERSEAYIRLDAPKSAPSKPKTIRRRIFEWFERGQPLAGLT